MSTTFRLVAVGYAAKIKGTTGDTVSRPELARLAPGALVRRESNGEFRRLGIMQSDWAVDPDTGEHYVTRSMLIDAEPEPGAWRIGADMTAEDVAREQARWSVS